MAFQRLLLYPALRIFSECPDLHKIVTACTCKALNTLSGSGRLSGHCIVLLGSNEGTRLGSRRPRDSITADSVAIEHIGTPLVIVWSAVLGCMECGHVKQNLLLKVNTESFPSEEAQARMAPNSCGAHETEFTTRVAYEKG